MQDKHRWSQIALALVSTTLIYNILEAVIAIWAGGAAESVALMGFGFDSAIETSAAVLLLWRLSLQAKGADTCTIERTEDKVRRFVGLTFFALVAYVVAQSSYTLWTQSAPKESTIGIILASASLVIMPAVAFFKLKAARILKSRALRAEAKETLACAYLSFALLIGLLANALLGWWWADPIAALLMVPWLIQEGREAYSGEDCCDD